jgi:hypothetical protein
MKLKVGFLKRSTKLTNLQHNYLRGKKMQITKNQYQCVDITIRLRESKNDNKAHYKNFTPINQTT